MRWISFKLAVVSEESVPVDQFVDHLLPSLLSLASDPVPNVRVLLAKALRQTLLEKAYFRNAGNHHLEIVEETLLALQSDLDQDVSFFCFLRTKDAECYRQHYTGKLELTPCDGYTEMASVHTCL